MICFVEVDVSTLKNPVMLFILINEKSFFGQYYSYYVVKCHQCYRKGSLGEGFNKNLKTLISLNIKCRLRTQATCASILQKYFLLTTTFEPKHL